MASTLLIPTALRAFTDGQGKVTLEGHTVGQLVAALAARYPDVQPHLYDDAGALRSFINLYVGEHNIKTTGGLETPVSDGAEVLLVPAIAGGVGKAI
ncbi:MoaD/ThiS family protein [Klebsiella variicola]|jgi:molybdopterin synthase sulfur carrier subunit|uniref:MoaD/ThiS family protein n=1 Tax=Klebsiella variicola TaxID=244366 RepID=A0A2N4YPS3_KLEVA|nr:MULTISPECIES: MoaD/ThiS family protein [Klebsiella]NHJ97271.1 MoaD/ThiS family protein [Klebsiella quasipneumoniae subsp. similipneumoniae]HBQ3453718.1 MoaD/ThiS family protein [Klebsiella variicola subsp. variicola]ELX9620778.1 MoaD/ThiS family protein [Klebsiella variicola]ELY7212725.1 MoaD/ThiS family protein [Klebsiella variicola]ELY7218174.1 MoaD/ThiS family protein [Klebsiella variicola]